MTPEQHSDDTEPDHRRDPPSPRPAPVDQDDVAPTRLKMQRRRDAYHARAESDLRNVMTGEEAYFVDNESYTTVVADLPGLDGGLSAGVALTINAADDTSWDAESSHPNGTNCFSYDSAADPGIQVAAGAC